MYSLAGFTNVHLSVKKTHRKCSSAVSYESVEGNIVFARVECINNESINHKKHKPVIYTKYTVNMEFTDIYQLMIGNILF